MMATKDLDEKLNKLIEDAGIKTLEKIGNEDENESYEPIFEFSDEHKKKMEKILATGSLDNDKTFSTKPNNFVDFGAGEYIPDVKPTEKPNNCYNTKSKKTKRTILLVAVLAIIMGVCTAGAWKGNIIERLFNVHKEYSDIGIKEISTDFQIDNIYFGYIPEGYEFTSKKVIKDEIIIHFQKNGGESFFVVLRGEKIWREQLNTEDSELLEIDIGKNESGYLEKDNLKIITWNENNLVYAVYTNSSKEMLTKIVKNIKILTQ